jgi:hypothetical protein
MKKTFLVQKEEKFEKNRIHLPDMKTFFDPFKKLTLFTVSSSVPVP